MSGLAPALRWISGLLHSAGIPFQIVGGVAARAYGSSRPVHDIDLYVPRERFEEAVDLVRPRVIRGPIRHTDEHWDLDFVVLEQSGRRIEIASDAARYYDREGRTWIDAAVDFSASLPIAVEGVLLPVIPRARLIEYKRRLDREVDRIDLAQIAGE